MSKTKLNLNTPLAQVFGISTALHVLLLLVFGSITIYVSLTDEQEFQPPPEITNPIEKKKFHVELQKRQQKSSAPRTNIVTVENPMQVNLPKIEMVENPVIKGTLQGHGDGKFGDGWGGAGFGGPSIQFMDFDVGGDRMVFVLDVSGSMREGEKFEMVAKAAESSISSMEPYMQFNIVVFWGKAKGFRPGEMVEANEKNKQLAIRWIRAQNPNTTSTSGTNPVAGLEEAFKMKPSTIVLLSDGEPTRGPRREDEILAAIENLQKDAYPEVTINTICFKTRDGAELMEAIAKANGGQFKQRD